MIIGHIAITALLQRVMPSDPRPLWTAAFFPDILDKTFCQIMGITQSGRMVGHTLLLWSLTTGLVHLVWGKPAGINWGLGYLAHLLADIGGFIPWLWPWRRYQFPRSVSLRTKWQQGELLRPTRLEWWLMMLAGLVYTLPVLTKIPFYILRIPNDGD